MEWWSDGVMEWWSGGVFLYRFFTELTGFLEKDKFFWVRLGSDRFGSFRITGVERFWRGRPILERIRRRESGRSCFRGFELLDTLTELAGESFEVRGGHRAECAAEDLLAECGQFSVELGKLLVDGSGDLLLDALLICEDAGSNFGAGLAAPGDEGWFWDAELAADAGEAQSANAEPEEIVTGSGKVHGDGVMELFFTVSLPSWPGFLEKNKIF
jgi:hypothetical protein